jgi:hypothetical protein
MDPFDATCNYKGVLQFYMQKKLPGVSMNLLVSYTSTSVVGANEAPAGVLAAAGASTSGVFAFNGKLGMPMKKGAYLPPVYWKATVRCKRSLADEYVVYEAEVR